MLDKQGSLLNVGGCDWRGVENVDKSNNLRSDKDILRHA